MLEMSDLASSLEDVVSGLKEGILMARCYQPPEEENSGLHNPIRALQVPTEYRYSGSQFSVLGISYFYLMFLFVFSFTMLFHFFLIFGIVFFLFLFRFPQIYRKYLASSSIPLFSFF